MKIVVNHTFKLKSNIKSLSYMSRSFKTYKIIQKKDFKKEKKLILKFYFF